MYIRFRLLFFLILSLSNCITCRGQEKQNLLLRYVNRLLNDTTESGKSHFLVYPTIGYAPETSWEFGFNSLYIFYAKKDTANRLSELNAFTFFTLENQYGLWLDHALYSHQNKWFFLGKLKFQSFPLLYFGIGPQTSKDFPAVVEANQILIKERILRNIYGNFYIGLEMDFQRLSQVTFDYKPGTLRELPPGAEGSTNLGFGSGIIFDNRHNVLNVRNGLFSELAFLKYARIYGSDYSFTTIINDNRIYKPVNKRDVIAGQLFTQINTGNIPFNQLALLGGESILRGYYLGRFRDNNMIAGQIEYRFLPLPLGFTNRLGAAVFLASGSVFDKVRNLNLNNFVVAGGAGLRILIFPKKDIYTRLDFAFTREGTGFYFLIGEAF